MAAVRILPETLSNKIAAGEVVERPASAVKELVENAIDARSSQIHVDVENGGRSLIRVSDNGIGMAPDDALLSIERYATSKIRFDEDLFAIRTLGFRGEALPSIAAVSRFSLITREEDSDSGTEIDMEGGKILRVSETGAPSGTMITVQNLFFNTPARRKFLKSVNTEMGHIADIISSMALAHPGIRFRLTHNGKLVHHFASSSDPLFRATDVLGKELIKDLYPVTANEGGIAVSGWAASDRHSRSTARGIYNFVNKRYVKDKIILHALFAGYEGRLMKGQFPLAAIFVELDPDRVDVNVHPTKHEVRFMDQKQVHETVARAISRALGKSFSASPPRFSTFSPNLENPSNKSRTPAPGFINTKFPVNNTPQTPGAFHEPVSRYQEIGNRNLNGKLFKEQTKLWEKHFFGDLVVIGQAHNSYIVCQSEDGVILIDQHAAHERVVYEEIKTRAGDGDMQRQNLLIPETFDLSVREAGVLNNLIEDLDKTGMEIEPFGGSTFAVKAVPAVLSDRDIKPMIREIIDKMIDIGFKPGLTHAMDACHIIMACHSAIRANQTLSEKQMTILLNQLDACENPGNCPHGRPTWVRWTMKDLEKLFRRIV
jgi:DNA mismatch repair protein MutL